MTPIPCDPLSSLESEILRGREGLPPAAGLLTPCYYYYFE